jgi:hypothetical protein
MLHSPPLDRAWLFPVVAVVGVVLAMLAASAPRATAAQSTSRQLWTGTIDGQKIEIRMEPDAPEEGPVTIVWSGPYDASGQVLATHRSSGSRTSASLEWSQSEGRVVAPIDLRTEGTWMLDITPPLSKNRTVIRMSVGVGPIAAQESGGGFTRSLRRTQMRAYALIAAVVIGIVVLIVRQARA